MHQCEERFAEAMQLSPSERAEITIQTKTGIVREGPYFDFSYEQIVTEVEGSLRALQTDYIDVLLLHRPDALVEPEEVARAFDELETAARCARSECPTTRPGRSICSRPPCASRSWPTRSSCRSRTRRRSPRASRRTWWGSISPTTIDGGGIVDYCRINSITLQAWSPFQAGFFNGVFLDNPDYVELNEVIDRLAAQYSVPAIAIATAWITRHPAGMQVVLGTTTPSRVADAALGSDVPLTRAEWYELFRAAGHRVP